jgi:hypothetical protein
VTNGNDLMAGYARTSGRWSNKGLVETGLNLVDVGDRGQMYGESKHVYMLGFVWQLFKAWIGSGKGKEEKVALD